MAVDDQTIRDFVAANISNPQAIADAAAANNVTPEQIAAAMQLPVETVTSYLPPTVNIQGAQYPTGTVVNESTGHVMQPTGLLDDNQKPEYIDITGGEINKAGGGGGGLFTIGNIIKIGLAYAIPVVGEAIAAELGTTASIGTALAAVGTGVAQGQTIEQAITSAAPALVANGIMSQVDVDGLKTTITNDKQLQNVITNVANSTLKTAIGGGDAKDILTNAIATGGGTLVGQTTGQTVGQGLATTLATGDIIKGAQAAAGSAGQQQATINDIERQVAPIMNAPASGIDAQTQALINQLGLSSQDTGINLAANAPPNLNAVAASAIPAMLGTGNEKSGPIQVKTDAEGEVTYARTITGVDANGKPYQYVATYDPLETTPNRQVSYSIPGLLGSSETAAPTVSGTASAYTRPTFDTTPEGQGISTKTPPDVTISTAGIGDKGSVAGVPGAGAGDTKAGPSDAGGTKGGVASTAGPGAGAAGPGDGSGAGGLGTGGAGTGGGKGTGGTGTGGGGGGGDGGGGDGSGVISVDTFKPTLTEIKPDQTKTDQVIKTTPPDITDSTDVSITTSAVKPKIQASYPTIAGQFASPLTQAVSAYRPPGEVESQATGKEREDVWNVESLRNALGI